MLLGRFLLGTSPREEETGALGTIGYVLFNFYILPGVLAISPLFLLVIIVIII